MELNPIKCESELNKNKKILMVEPYYGGSHKLFIDTLVKNLNDCTLVTLSAKKWHWRARCSALLVKDKIPRVTSEKTLFCSSVLNLAELLGIRPDLHVLKKIVYFHENQLIYPVQNIKERDIQYSYNEIMTCLAADVVLFNSDFNKSSFLTNLNKVIKLIPDYRPKNIKFQIETKCRTLYFPVEFPLNIQRNQHMSSRLRIVWPHRWEFDKGPEEFYECLGRLKAENLSFEIVILGESFAKNPPIFDRIKSDFAAELVHFGYVDRKEDYYRLLSTSHIVVSTAKHEFYGIALLEAVYCGCYPLVPDRLVYPEIYPSQCLYTDLDDLCAKLEIFSISPNRAVEERTKLNIDLAKYSNNRLMPDYINLFNE